MTATDQELRQTANDHYASRFGEIGRLLTLMHQAQELGHDVWMEEILERIQEQPLSVALVTIYPQRETCEWEILLGTGGPADRVLVQTDENGDIDSAQYQHQDWFTPWIDATDQDDDLVADFAAQFYFEPVGDFAHREWLVQ